MRCCRSLLVLALAGLLVGATAGHARADDEPEPKAKLFVFFATWCVPCRIELPHIQRLHETYGGQGLAVTLVSEDAPSTAVNVPSFLARFDITAPWVIDTDSALLERYNPSANVPFTAIVDANGKLVYAHAGYEPGVEKLIEAAVVKALAAAPSDAEQTKSFAQVQSATQALGVWRQSRFDNVNPGRLRAAVGRVEVTGHTEVLDVGVRVDGALVDDAVAGSGAERNDARLERAHAAYDLGPVKLQAGDDYAAFGHGVTLSLRKVDPLGVDTSLQGGRIDAEYDFVSVTALAGWTNPQNIDPIELRIVDDVHDLIAGTEVRFDLGDVGNVAPYVLYAEADSASAVMTDITWIVGGASTSLVLGDVRISAEGAAGERSGVAVDGDQTAWAGYAAVQLTTGRATTLIDAKAYRHWEIGRQSDAADGRTLLYHEPPTLEREDQEVPSNQDAVGARARVEYRLPIDATVFGNALYYRYAEDGADPLDRDVAVHGYVGGEKRFANGVNGSLEVGYRQEWAKNLATDELEDKLFMWHVDVDAAVPLAKRLAATVKWNHRSEEKPRTGLEFVRGLAVLGLSIPGLGVASFLYGYSTEEAPTPTHYPAGELLYHLPKGGSVRLFFGRLTGGRVCVSGSCRDVPPFEGGRLDLILHL